MSCLEELISEYGLTDLNPILKNIHSFDDLLVFGKAFIENKLYRSVNYLGMFGKSSDTDGHDSQRDNLIKCHKYRCFTTGGQINKKTETYQQRSYITFWCEPEIAEKLKIEFEKRNDIYYTLFYSNKPNFTNYNTKKINLTRVKINETEFNEYTNFWPLSSYTEICLNEYTRREKHNEIKYHSNYNNIFQSLVHIELCVKEYNYSIESADILLSCLHTINN
jgi:hypothetical protein